jgi:hypothetical protein
MPVTMIAPLTPTILDRSSRLASTRDRSRGCSDQTQRHRPVYVRRPLHDGGLGHATDVSSCNLHAWSKDTDNTQVTIRHQMRRPRRRRRHRQNRRPSQKPQNRPKSRTQTHSRRLPYLRILQNRKRNLLSEFRDDWSAYRW